MNITTNKTMNTATNKTMNTATNKTTSVFAALPEADRRALRVWLAAPYNKVREDAVRLFEYLYNEPHNEQYKGQNSESEYGHTLVVAHEDWDKNNVFQHLYGEKPYNDDWLRHAQSLLTKAIERYLVEQKTAENAAQTAFLLAERYHELSAEKPFQAAFRQLQTASSGAKTRNAAALYWEAAGEDLWFRHTTERLRNSENNLQAMILAQEKHFAAVQLHLACTALSYQNIHKTTYDFGLLEPLLQRINAQNWQRTEPAIGAYFFIYKMNTETESEPFFDILNKNIPFYATVFDEKAMRDCYLAAINYAIKQTNKGQKHYFKILFDLYKTGIESSVLLGANGKLSPYTYKNMTAIGLRIGETAYISGFIERYKNTIAVEFRQNYYEYNLARYYFTIKNLAQAMPLLKKLTYGDIFLQLDAKVMLFKIHYTEDDYDALDAHLRAFQQFVQRRKKSLAYHQQNYFNIIHCAKQLMAHNSIFDKKAQQKSSDDLRELFTNLQPFTEREWFLQQL
jgi:hypothetical protein